MNSFDSLPWPMKITQVLINLTINDVYLGVKLDDSVCN